MSSLAYVAIWVMFSVLVGVTVGYCLGHNNRHNKERQISDQQRNVTLRSLVELLKSTEQLTTDVDSHSSEMKNFRRHVGDLKVSGELELVQHSLLGHIAGVLKSNQRLEDDLVVARARMEEQAQEIDRTRLEARTDVLSGTANRKAFDERLQLLFSNWRRERRSFVLVLADIDHFKRINDTHGHQAGDRVVTHVGTFLRQIVRGGDYVARYGGDEFAILMPNLDLDDGLELVETIRAAIARSNFDIGLRGEQATVTFSIGIAAPCDDDTIEKLVKRADQGLYKSKQCGRNQVNCQRSEQPAGPGALVASIDLAAATPMGVM